MLEYLNANQATVWFALGATALIIELLVLGMSTIILFMLGLAGLLTGFLVYLGIVPENWGWGFACLGICTAVLGVLLWQPLKRYQDVDRPRSGHSSDFIGLEFSLSSVLDPATHSSHDYSGVSWRVELAAEEGDKALAPGDRVKVVALQPGVMVVAQA